MQLNTSSVTTKGEVSLFFSPSNNASELSISEICEIAAVPASDRVISAIKEKIIDSTTLRESGLVGDSSDGIYLPISLVRYGHSSGWSQSAFNTQSLKHLQEHTAKVRAVVQDIVKAAQEAHENNQDKITEQFCETFFPVDLV